MVARQTILRKFEWKEKIGKGAEFPAKTENKLEIITTNLLIDKHENQNIMTTNILLRDSEISPTNEVVENALGNDIFQVYEELIKSITDVEFDLKPEWNFYKDGKAWLCKVTFKKKTVFWLSVWEKCIKTGFYFTDKTREGIFALQIDEKLIQDFKETKKIGKLFPLVLDIDTKRQLEDLKEIIKYKKGLK